MAKSLTKQTFGVPSADTLNRIDAAEKVADLQAAEYRFRAKLVDLERQFEAKVTCPVSSDHV